MSCPLALDICRDAAKTYSLMHGSKLIENTVKIQDLSSPCIIVADVLQKEPWMAASILQINTTTLSIPCVTFSSAGMKRGWCSETLDLFRASVTRAKQIGVQYLLLENVAPLWTDLAWRSTLIQELMQAGFHLIFAENIQVRATVPVDRTRFIAVAIESNVKANWTPSKRFEILRAFGGSACALGQENMWFHCIPHCLQDQVSLTDEELELYASIKRSPKTAGNPEQALRARIIGRHETLPATTLMRSYSQQHKFKSVMRGEAKLLGNLREDDTGRPRLFSQVEIITATGVTNGINMPMDLKQGCAQAGNAITQIHALAGFWVIIESKDATGSGDFDTFRQCVDIFRKCRITASSEAIFAEERCMIGFTTHDPTYAIAHNECLIRIHFNEISKLIRTARNTSIQQLLREEKFSGELDMQAWYKGIIVPFAMKIKSGGSLRIVCT